MSLTNSDQRRLRAILDKGHALEIDWSRAPCALELVHLKKLVCELAESAESEDLRRLAFHHRDLTGTMTSAHLAAILVPFERLLGKAVREDEFLVTDSDTDSRDVAPLTVIADNIRSAFNVGAIFRTAEAFGAESILLTGYTSTPDDKATAKTSLGAESAIDWKHVPKASVAVADLKADGYSVVALETAEGAETLGRFQWPEKTALILGNERFGIDHTLLSQADHVLKIPLFGKKNSLNVGIALGVALNDWRRTRTPNRSQKSIGIFSATTRNRYEARRQGAENRSQEIGVIDLQKGCGFEQALEDLAGFERIWLLYEFNRNSGWKPKVLPPRGPSIKRGVFATRSPHRPNAIGLTAVELVKVTVLQVFVRGFDLLDQTPILDIKPYLPEADAFPASRAGWTENLKTEAFQVSFDDLATRQLSWLYENGVTQIRDFLHSQLEYVPTDSARKRVWASDRDFILAYRTWRARFSVQFETKQVCVHQIWSGYDADDLARLEDPHQDKDRHRKFVVENFD